MLTYFKKAAGSFFQKFAHCETVFFARKRFTLAGCPNDEDDTTNRRPFVVHGMIKMVDA